MPIDSRLASIADRIHQQRASSGAERDELARATSRAERDRLTPFQPGDRVFDTVSGLFGVILERHTRNIVVSNP